MLSILTVIDYLPSGLQMPVGAVYEKNVDFSKPGYERKPKNLYVTTASMFNSPSFNSTVGFLEDNFIERKKTDKEIWLLGTDIEVEPDEESRLFHNIIIIIDNKFINFNLNTAETYSG